MRANYPAGDWSWSALDGALGNDKTARIHNGFPMMSVKYDKVLGSISRLQLACVHDVGQRERWESEKRAIYYR